MKEQQIESIQIFLEDWPINDSLSSPFINAIRHQRFVNDLPKDETVSPVFWYDHIMNCCHFYVYAILNKWNNEIGSDIIAFRKKSYSTHFMTEIVEEADRLLLFIKDTDTPSGIKEYIAHSVETFLDENISDDFLLKIFCKNNDLKIIYQTHRDLFFNKIKIMQPELVLSFLFDYLQAYQPIGYNRESEKYYIQILIQKLLESYSFPKFEHLLNQIKDISTDVEWEHFISQLEDGVANCLRYCGGNAINVDGIILGVTSYAKVNEIIKNNKVDSKVSFDEIWYGSINISFDEKIGGICRSMHIFSDKDDTNYKKHQTRFYLNHLLKSIFRDPTIDSKNMSYNDFIHLLNNNDFFELQKFHYSSHYKEYSARWRQVTPSYVCDFIFTIDADDEELAEHESVAREKKDIIIQLDICINDFQDQDELYKTIPIPPDESRSLEVRSPNYDFGLIKDNEPWFYIP